LHYQIGPMTFKKLLFLLTVLLSFSAQAQEKVFTIHQFQARNEFQEWGKREYVCNQFAAFSPDKINLEVDKNYQLTIISKTDLPDNGIIYLCRDEKSNPVTVMLIDKIKMYLYTNTKRFLINFGPEKMVKQLADSD